MPILTADMSAGTLVTWRRKPGDAVKHGDIIAEVETDKGLIDVEVYVSGVIERIVVEPGATVPTGTVLAIIRAEPGAVQVSTPGVTVAPPAVAAAPPVAAAVPMAPAVAPGRARISPLARSSRPSYTSISLPCAAPARGA